MNRIIRLSMIALLAILAHRQAAAQWPVDLTTDPGLTVTSNQAGHPTFPLSNLTDKGDTTSFSSLWLEETANGIQNTAEIIFEWASPVHIEYVEVANFYENMRSYSLSTWDGSQWVTNHTATDLPNQIYRIDAFRKGELNGADFPDQTTRLRINITAVWVEGQGARLSEVTVLDALPPTPDRPADYNLAHIAGTSTGEFRRINQQDPFFDVTGDGLVDLALPSATGSRIYLQAPTEPRFAADSYLELSKDGAQYPSAMFYGHLNNDAFPDVGILQGHTTAVVETQIFRGTSSGVEGAPFIKFSPPTSRSVVTAHYGTSGDVNGDGRQDILYNASPGQGGGIHIALQQADGSWDMTVAGGAYRLSGDNGAGALLAVSPDGEARHDVLKVNGGDTIFYWHNNGTWSADFNVTRTLDSTYVVDRSVSGPKSDIAVGDVDGDGGLDLVASGGTGIAVWTNQSTLWATGQLGVPPDFELELAWNILGCALADINSDGRDDLVVGGDLGYVFVLLANASGPLFNTGNSRVYQVEGFFAVGDVVVQDLDNNNNPDLVAIEQTWGNGAVVMDVGILPNAVSNWAIY